MPARKHVDGIAKPLREAVEGAGFRPGLFTGDSDDSDLDEFRKPNGWVDVLIASSRVSTGVDGLQHVCNKSHHQLVAVDQRGV
jgi:hypothetical protein